jgi:hypothetical protein
MAEATEVKHTPGPWQIREARDDAWEIQAADPSLPTHLRPICELLYTGGNAEANARLIAETPTFFALVEKMISRHYQIFGHDEGCMWHGGEDCDCGGDDARAAIARARGAQ